MLEMLKKERRREKKRYPVMNYMGELSHQIFCLAMTKLM